MRSLSEPAIYIRRSDSSQLIVGVYVDDLVVTWPHKEEICKFKREMAVEFKMCAFGLLRYYLGIEVRQGADGITLCQGSYASKILEKVGLADCNPRQTPMEVRLKLSKQSIEPLVEATLFRSIVGSLRYLVNTRADIAFAVGYVSRFLSEPHEDHMLAVKHILRYIAGTLNWGVHLKKGSGKTTLVGCTDSDFAGDVDSRKKYFGCVLLLNTSPVTWQSNKQSMAAQLSCEAEYVATTSGAYQALWLSRVLGGEVKVPTLLVDNQSTMALIKNPVLSGHSKHIEVKYYLVRESAE
jgi:hypothetical protein